MKQKENNILKVKLVDEKIQDAAQFCRVLNISVVMKIIVNGTLSSPSNVGIVYKIKILIWNKKTFDDTINLQEAIIFIIFTR